MDERNLGRRASDKPASHPMTDVEHHWVRSMMAHFPSPEQAAELGKMVRGHERVLFGGLNDEETYVPGTLQSMSKMADSQTQTNRKLETTNEKLNGLDTRLIWLNRIVGALVIVVVIGNTNNAVSVFESALRVVFHP